MLVINVRVSDNYEGGREREGKKRKKRKKERKKKPFLALAPVHHDITQMTNVGSFNCPPAVWPYSRIYFLFGSYGGGLIGHVVPMLGGHAGHFLPFLAWPLGMMRGPAKSKRLLTCRVPRLPVLPKRQCGSLSFVAPSQSRNLAMSPWVFPLRNNRVRYYSVLCM
jgi:hypothetical protein